MNDTDRSRRSGVVVEKAYQFLLWLVPTLEKFPKSQKFLLADRIQVLALDVLEGLAKGARLDFPLYSCPPHDGALPCQPSACSTASWS